MPLSTAPARPAGSDARASGSTNLALHPFDFHPTADPAASSCHGRPHDTAHAQEKSSIWLRHLELFSVATGARPKQPATGPRPAAKRASKPAAKPTATARAARRTGAVHPARPRSNTAPGTWRRSFHSAGPSAGRLVNHLAYALYLPAAPATTAGMPVVVMLHGCKQTAESFAAGTRMCGLAERSGFAVLFPEQATTAHPHRCWHWHGDTTESRPRRSRR